MRLGITVAVGFALGWAADWGPMRRLEWLSEEVLLKVRERYAFVPPTGDVVLLAIDEQALQVHKQWPFARSVHGDLVQWLGHAPEMAPAVMSWDIVFSEESYDPALDQLFVEPLSKVGYPVLVGAFTDAAARGVLTQGQTAEKLGLTQPLPLPADIRNRLKDLRGMQTPIRALLDVTRFTLLDADADDDGVIRKIPLLGRVGDQVFPGLVLGTLMTYWQVKPEDVEVRLGDAVIVHTTRGERRIPVDAAGYYHLNYRYDVETETHPRGLPVISYQEVYERLAPWVAFGDAMPTLPVSGKILVVGQTATGLTDIGPSPLRSQSGKVFVHLNALENILRGDYLRRTSVWPVLSLLLMVGLGAAWVLDRSRRWYYGAVGLLVVGAIGVAGGLLIVDNAMIPLAVPLLAFGGQQAAVLMLKIREEQAQRDRIRKMFGSYVSPELVRRMVEARVEPRLGGHEEEITAFFSDIQGFSAFSEILSAADLVVLLNDYLGAMTDILQDGGGALDKYIGDAIVAMFGGLVPLPDHARRACEAAAKMQRRQAELRKHWRAQGDRWPPLVHAMRTRIGLNSGRVVVGNMGSSHRFNYTMMGDAVNLAARCESGAKSFGVYTAATEATVGPARAAGCACVFRELDRIVVKGRSDPVKIFEIVALSPQHLPEGAARCLELFAEGRRHYLNQDWSEARRCFAEAALLEPLQPERDEGVEANPSLIMLERCNALQAHPPGEAWDGIYHMTTK